MGFTTPAFIRKNTLELRKKLERLGYYLHPECIDDDRGNYLFVNREYYLNRPLGYSEELSRSIDCGTNEDLFLALAALRDDTDKEQFFVTEVRCGSINDPYTIIEKGALLKCYMDKWKIPKNKFDSMGIPSHKATVEELIEYFKGKE